MCPVQPEPDVLFRQRWVVRIYRTLVQYVYYERISLVVCIRYNGRVRWFGGPNPRALPAGRAPVPPLPEPERAGPGSVRGRVSGNLRRTILYSSSGSMHPIMHTTTRRVVRGRGGRVGRWVGKVGTVLLASMHTLLASMLTNS